MILLCFINILNLRWEGSVILPFEKLATLKLLFKITIDILQYYPTSLIACKVLNINCFYHRTCLHGHGAVYITTIIVSL